MNKSFIAIAAEQEEAIVTLLARITEAKDAVAVIPANQLKALGISNLGPVLADAQRIAQEALG